MAEDGKELTGQLVQVHDPGPALQRLANEQVPLGWCNACIGEAKLALASGNEPGQIDAAIVMSPSEVQQNTMAGTIVMIVPLGVCWRHVSGKKPSGLLGG